MKEEQAKEQVKSSSEANDINSKATAGDAIFYGYWDKGKNGNAFINWKHMTTFVSDGYQFNANSESDDKNPYGQLQINNIRKSIDWWQKTIWKKISYSNWTTKIKKIGEIL